MKTLLLMAALWAAGCGGQTTLRLTVEAADLQPQSLRLTLWGDALLRPPADIALGGKLLPGSLILTHLNASTPHFRLLIEGLDGNGALIAEGAARVPLSAGKQASYTVQLQDGKLADGDGDGVPDAVDDCPQVADVDQRCAAPAQDGAASPRDLAAAGDLAGSGDLAMPPDAAAPVDLAGADLSHGPACPSFAFFCDDFESGNFDAAKWGAKYDPGGGSSLTVDSVQPFHGSWAAHATATSNVIWAPHSFAPIASGMVAFRGYFLTPAALQPSVYFFYLHRPGTAPVDSDYVVGFDNFASSGQWTVFNKNPGNPYEMTGSFAPMQWHCVELDVALSSANKLEFYLDGAGPQTVNVPATDSVGTLNEFDIGVTYQSGATTNQWFIDDVALATQHIGCE